MEKIILGIDPGTNVMGFGLIRAENKVLSVLEIGVIELQKIKDPYLKLRKIYTSLTEIVEKYAPDEMALEAPFYGKNVQ
jgi:crossover junction endodeoxyribonuclease RuvC